MSAECTPLERDVRRVVRERAERGCSHVKTHYVAGELEESSARVAPIMQKLVRSGELEVWRETRNAAVYAIALEDVA